MSFVNKKRPGHNSFMSQELSNAGMPELEKTLLGLSRVNLSQFETMDARQGVVGETAATQVDRLPSYRAGVRGHPVGSRVAGFAQIIEETHKAARSTGKTLFSRVTENDPELNKYNAAFLCWEEAAELVDNAHKVATGNKGEILKLVRFANMSKDAEPSEFSNSMIRDIQLFIKALPRQSEIEEDTQHFLRTGLERVVAALQEQKGGVEIEAIEKQFKKGLESTENKLLPLLEKSEFSMTLPVKTDGATEEAVVTRIENAKVPNWNPNSMTPQSTSLLKMLWALSMSGDRIDGRAAEETIHSTAGRGRNLTKKLNLTIETLQEQTGALGVYLDSDDLLLAPMRNALSYFVDKNKGSVLALLQLPDSPLPELPDSAKASGSAQLPDSSLANLTQSKPSGSDLEAAGLARLSKYAKSQGALFTTHHELANNLLHLVGYEVDKGALVPTGERAAYDAAHTLAK